MNTPPRRIPIRRPDVSIKAVGSDGDVVARAPHTGSYIQLGPQENFVLGLLDGKTKRETIQARFAQEFGDTLPDEELFEFIRVAQGHGLLDMVPPNNELSDPSPTSAESHRGVGQQSILYWRYRILDPDRLLARMVPFLRFCWTRAFFWFSALFIAVALAVAASNFAILTGHVRQSVSWQSGIVALLSLLAITILHEFAHGLTCKRHGGEVHEMGFLLMFFLPCLYCNVSDAWMISEKRHRLWVTAAGGFIEMCLWACAVFVWRLTVQNSAINYVALTIITVSGTRILFNCNPFLKLDGYYLLTDYLDTPNLRSNSWEYVAAHLRWLLWGAPRPERLPGGKGFILYGVACWFFSVFATVIMLKLLGAFLYGPLGLLGIAIATILGMVAAQGLFSGLIRGEVSQMFWQRRKRTAVGLSLATALILALCIIPMPRRATGTFVVCPLRRHDIRTPIAGFLKEVKFEEGAEVTDSAIIAVVEVNDLDSQITRKQAEIREVAANLALLKKGASKEELDEQLNRVQRAKEWVDLGAADLKTAEVALQEDLKRLDQKAEQYKAEVAQSKINVARTKELADKRAVTLQQYEEEMKRVKIAEALLGQAVSERATRETLGTVLAQQELAKRQKELADEQGKLELLQAGSRVEAIDAEKAKLARLEEELKYLRELHAQQPIPAKHHGVVVTPRVKEKVGQYLKEGDLICAVEEISALELEINMPEDEIRDVKPGLPVRLKARALPYETFETSVDRIAPRAQQSKEEIQQQQQNSVVVYAFLKDSSGQLRPGMTGYARVECGSAPIAKVALDYVLKYIRTEFWW